MGVSVRSGQHVLGSRVVAVDPYDAARDADAVVPATDWEACTRLDFDRLAAVMRGRLLADGRNAWDAAAARQRGWYTSALAPRLRPHHLLAFL